MCCCGWAGDGACLGSGGQVGRRGTEASGHHLSASRLCLQGQGDGALAQIAGEFADIPCVCGALGTQPLLTGALSSADHSCVSRGLDTYLVTRKLEEFTGDSFVFWLPDT